MESSTRHGKSGLKRTPEATSNHFEPQGELLHGQNLHNLLYSEEFSIPQAVSGSGVTWPFNRHPIAANTAEHESNSAVGYLGVFATDTRLSGMKRKSDRHPVSPKKLDNKRLSRSMSVFNEEPISPSDLRPPVTISLPESSAANIREGSEPDVFSGSKQDPPASGVMEDMNLPQNSGDFPAASSQSPAPLGSLPSRKVFPIQIGDKLFRLSGASISSDAPSYFSQFFEEQLRQNNGANSIRTLYIDRDATTFEDISRHLQGYHVEPRDGPHFVKLFADAHYYSLPRLAAQLFASTIYVRVGGSEFQIPRDIFNNPGDSPNYFSLGFSVFFSSPNDVFPGLSDRTLLRPPSILPPNIPNRSARTFADLLQFLKGYPVEIRNEEHRTELLRDARYYHLKGLEQRLIPHAISYNIARERSEIVIRLEDVRQSGISFIADGQDNQSPGSTATSPASSAVPAPSTSPGWIYYQRPFVDTEAYSLILEIGDEESAVLEVFPRKPTTSHTERRTSASTVEHALHAPRFARATFHRRALLRITSLFTLITHKMNLPVSQPLGLMMLERGKGHSGVDASLANTGISEDRVKVRLGLDADIVVNGLQWPEEHDLSTEHPVPKKGKFRQRQAPAMNSEVSSDPMDVSPGSKGEGLDESSSHSARPLAHPGRTHKAAELEEEHDGDDENSNSSSSAPVSHDDSGNDYTAPPSSAPELWILRRAQWRLRVQPVTSHIALASSSSYTPRHPGAASTSAEPAAAAATAAAAARSGMEVILEAVKIQAFTTERKRNSERAFLTS